MLEFRKAVGRNMQIADLYEPIYASENGIPYKEPGAAQMRAQRSIHIHRTIYMINLCKVGIIHVYMHVLRRFNDIIMLFFLHSNRKTL